MTNVEILTKLKSGDITVAQAQDMLNGLKKAQQAEEQERQLARRRRKDKLAAASRRRTSAKLHTPGRWGFWPYGKVSQWLHKQQAEKVRARELQAYELAGNDFAFPAEEADSVVGEMYELTKSDAIQFGLSPCRRSTKRNDKTGAERRKSSKKGKRAKGGVPKMAAMACHGTEPLPRVAFDNASLPRRLPEVCMLPIPYSPVIVKRTAVEKSIARHHRRHPAQLPTVVFSNRMLYMSEMGYPAEILD